MDAAQEREHLLAIKQEHTDTRNELEDSLRKINAQLKNPMPKLWKEELFAKRSDIINRLSVISELQSQRKKRFTELWGK